MDLASRIGQRCVKETLVKYTNNIATLGLVRVSQSEPSVAIYMKCIKKSQLGEGGGKQK